MQKHAIDKRPLTQKKTKTYEKFDARDRTFNSLSDKLMTKYFV